MCAAEREFLSGALLMVFRYSLPQVRRFGGIAIVGRSRMN
jgi:hypothetical protein